MAPRVRRFEAVDPDEGDLTYSIGDRFELEFDMATNRALDAGGRAYLNTLFIFFLGQARTSARPPCRTVLATFSLPRGRTRRRSRSSAPPSRPPSGQCSSG